MKLQHDALEKISNWLVCAAIATPEDMAQSFESMLNVTLEALGEPTTGQNQVTPDENLLYVAAFRYALDTGSSAGPAIVRKIIEAADRLPDHTTGLMLCAIADKAKEHTENVRYQHWEDLTRVMEDKLRREGKML